MQFVEGTVDLITITVDTAFITKAVYVETKRNRLILIFVSNKVSDIEESEPKIMSTTINDKLLNITILISNKNADDIYKSMNINENLAKSKLLIIFEKIKYDKTIKNTE